MPSHIKKGHILLLITLIGCAALFTADQYYRSQISQGNEDQLIDEAQHFEERLAHNMAMQLVAVEDLKAFLLASPDLPDFEAFDYFADALISNYPTIRTVQYVDTQKIIRHLYPLEGNEAALNLDLMTRPAAPFIETAVRERRTTINHPTVTVQGSLSIVARAPLYKGDGFLGLAQSVFDIDDILVEELDHLDRRIDVRLVDATDKHFWGVEKLHGETQTITIPIGDNYWEMTLGWDSPPPPDRFVLVLIWGVGSALLVSILYAVNRTWDITAWLSKEVAEKTKQLLDHNEQLQIEITRREQVEETLHKVNRAYRTLSESNQAVVRATDETALMQQLCRVIVESGGYRLAWVGFAEQDEAKAVRPVSWAGFEEGYLETLEITWADSKRGQSPVGRAFRTGKPSVARHILTDPDFEPWRAEALARDYASSIALPLLINDRVIGALNIYAVEPDAFDAEETQLLVELAGDLAYGIMTLRTQAERERVEQAYHESVSFVETIIASANDGIIVYDPEFRFKVWNHAMEDMTGLSATEVLGHKAFDLFPHLKEQGVDWLHQRALAGDSVSSPDTPYHVPRTGKEGWVVGRYSPLRSTNGDIIGVVAIVRDVTTRKQTEKELRKLSLAVEQSPSTIFITDAEGKIEYVNRKFTELTGYGDEEVIGQLPRLLESDEIAREEYEERWNILRSGGEWRGEFQNRKKNGERFWEFISISSIKDNNGAIANFVVVKEDITALKQAQKAEREQRLLAEALRDTAAALSSTLDLDEVLDRILTNIERVVDHEAADIILIDANTDTARIVRCQGYAEHGTEEEILALRFTVTHTPNLHRVTLSGQPHTIPDTQVDPDWVEFPETRWIRSNVTAPIHREGQVIGFLSLHSATPGFFTPAHALQLQAFGDQTAIALENARLYQELAAYSEFLEQAVEERTRDLRRAMKRVETILNSVGDALMLLRTDGPIEQVNPAFEDQTGYAAHEVELRHHSLLFNETTPKDTVEEIVAALRTGQVWRGELPIRRKDGTVYEAALTTAPVRNEKDEPVISVIIMRDITERKQAEETLRQALEREMEVGEMRMRFLSMASHDLRTPLAVIQASTDIVAQYSDRLSDEKKQAKYDQIRDSIRHMIELLDDVLAIGRMEAGRLQFNPEALDVAVFCQHIVSDLQTSIGADHPFDFSVAGTRVTRMVDPSLLRHVLYNLLSNAIKYSPEGSTVTCQLACEDDWVVFRVSDEGIGIPLADQERLFSAFHRAGNVGSVQGTGLGLAIVKQSVERHGGTIVFESEEGAGTTFTVTIPDFSASEGIHEDDPEH